MKLLQLALLAVVVLFLAATPAMAQVSAPSSATIAGADGWKSHRDWHFRLAALNAASASRDTGVVAGAARSMLRDPDGRVRATAYGVLAGNDTAAPPKAVHDALVAGLSDPDFYARATIIGNLAQHASRRKRETSGLCGVAPREL